ncbi:MAG: chromosome segregation protein SMC, partial [Bacteroidia bacterium]|nr:chromosome segregation protein SMC [Bacteroidia bacterium]
MKLKSLDIKGFKSFGDKVTIHFDQGVTAIVGPNGSGKSNVVDAIRWVLGEQKTRMLRSEKMENIIFNGTKNRKPGNSAEVTLTFENTKNLLPTEFSTVAISRRLFRNGNSEYAINGVTCRLKDIVNMFLDTGIGPDSYAIIELKMVDDILSDRGSSVMNLLEEAAGISKYKLRKKQTLSKLDDTDKDLKRVADLMTEIIKTLKTLENQAKKTDRYYRLKEEYKVLSRARAVYQLQSFKVKNDELQELETKQQDEKIKLTSEIDKLEAEIQQQKTEVIEKERLLAESQKLMNEKMIEIAAFENEKKSGNEKLSFLVDKKEHLSTSQTHDTKRIEELTEKINSLSSEKEEAQNQLSEQENTLSDLKLEADEHKQLFENKQQQLQELNEKILSTKHDINQIEKGIAVEASRHKSIVEESQRVHEHYNSNLAEITRIENEISELNPQKDQQETDLNDLVKQRDEAKQHIQENEEVLTEKKNELGKLTRSVDAKTNEYDLTKNLLERMDGFPDSIKYLKKNDDKFHHTPLLAELISCDENYKLAIENYLEPFLNYFVVDTFDDAWSGIESLKNSAKGRANFFALESFSNKNDGNITAPSGSVRAIDKIEFDSKYTNLLEYLLGHVYISDDTVFRSINVKDDESFVLLSKNGNFIKQKHKIAGGSVGLFDGKRTGNVKNLESLSKKIDKLNASIKELDGEIEKIENSIAADRLTLEESNNQIKKSEIKLSEFGTQLNSLISNKDFLQNGVENHKVNIGRLEDELKNITSFNPESTDVNNAQLTDLHSNYESLLEEQKSKQDEVNSAGEELNTKSSDFNEHNISVIQQKNKIQTLDRDAEYNQNQVDNLNKAIEDRKSELEYTDTQVNELIETLKGSDDGLQSLLVGKEEFATKLQENEEAYYTVKGVIEEKQEKINQFRKNKENTDAVLQEAHQGINDLKLELSSLKERLNIEFNLDINDLLEETPDEQYVEEELHEKVEKQRHRLENFGAINPMALESFEELKERHDFIVKEQEDLEKAKESLLQTIAEIEESARVKFLEAFHQVKENFTNVFRTLFSEEDNADLVLTNIENPLESDIHIIAQPKGKKPLSIHQLSGGEKTLTATALLFGIYLLKPA